MKPFINLIIFIYPMETKDPRNINEPGKTKKKRYAQAGPKTYSGIVDSFQNFKVSIGVKVRADH